MSKFALIVESLEARSGYNDNIMTKAGEEFLVTIEPDGWVEATSERFDKTRTYSRAKLFDSVEAATEFAKRWKGHPWWCQPNGNFRVLEVEPQFKKVLTGYQIKNKE